MHSLLSVIIAALLLSPAQAQPSVDLLEKITAVHAAFKEYNDTLVVQLNREHAQRQKDMAKICHLQSRSAAHLVHLQIMENITSFWKSLDAVGRAFYADEIKSSLLRPEELYAESIPSPETRR